MTKLTKAQEKRFREFWNPSGSHAKIVGEKLKQHLADELARQGQFILDIIEEAEDRPCEECGVPSVSCKHAGVLIAEIVQTIKGYLKQT